MSVLLLSKRGNEAVYLKPFKNYCLIFANPTHFNCNKLWQISFKMPDRKLSYGWLTDLCTILLPWLLHWKPLSGRQDKACEMQGTWNLSKGNQERGVPGPLGCISVQFLPSVTLILRLDQAYWVTWGKKRKKKKNRRRRKKFSEIPASTFILPLLWMQLL